MERLWASFPYQARPQFHVSRGWCEAEQHDARPRKHRPRAAWLELLYKPRQGPDQTMLVVHAWRTCEGCHTRLEANPPAQYHPLREAPPGMYRAPRHGPPTTPDTAF